MADEFDRASETEELMRASALYQHSKLQQKVIVATGYCLYCEAPLEDGRRWCDADCRDDWEREQKRK